MEIENISGKKKVIVAQDFYAQMLLYNMAEDIKNDANDNLKCDNKNAGFLKYEYKVNLNILIGTFREYMIKIVIEDDENEQEKLYKWMIEEISENLVPIRSGRKNERKPYRTANKYKSNYKRNS